MTKHPEIVGQKIEAIKALAHTMQCAADLHVEDMDDLQEASEYISNKAHEIMTLIEELNNAI